MSIKLDWELTDAPTGEDKSPLAPVLSPQPAPPLAEPEAPAAAPPRPRRYWLLWALVVVVLGVAGGAGAWLVTRSGWQRVTADVTALVHYEEVEALRGQTQLVMAVQDPQNTDWLVLRMEELARSQPAPEPLPMLRPLQGEIAVGGLEAVEADVVMAVVGRQFEMPGGQVLSFNLPQFYRGSAGSDWRRSAPPGGYWGIWQSWESPHLVIRYSERDAAFVARAAPTLEKQLAAACAGWQDACFNASPAQLYLSGFVGSIGYDPLNNVEVRISQTPGSADAAGYYLSVPSPQIAGIPADAASEQLLTDYLAVRLIASLAQHTTRDAGAYQTLTTLAINLLQLGHADPGYVAAATQAQRDTAPAGDQATSSLPQGPVGAAISPASPDGRAPVAIPRPKLYQVMAGDSLSSIAAQFATTVEELVRLNSISNPDAIQANTYLNIPPAQQ